MPQLIFKHCAASIEFRFAFIQEPLLFLQELSEFNGLAQGRVFRVIRSMSCNRIQKFHGWFTGS